MTGALMWNYSLRQHDGSSILATYKIIPCFFLTFVSFAKNDGHFQSYELHNLC